MQVFIISQYPWCLPFSKVDFLLGNIVKKMREIAFQSISISSQEVSQFATQISVGCLHVLNESSPLLPKLPKSLDIGKFSLFCVRMTEQKEPSSI